MIIKSISSKEYIFIIVILLLIAQVLLVKSRSEISLLKSIKFYCKIVSKVTPISIVKQRMLFIVKSMRDFLFNNGKCDQ